ncbi:DmsC/YnfH family molybdoenzyme membrane anchor subunit [Mesorhizobium sp. 8]|uniref:dimethyl sulfoxide reductase anchor subunit family protein n=1 Tax=Mesorhizobium sp. 8 TaxID=2584466 RepID=UPI0011218E72|nr:DmsC/YnfH family molybdoenzyme membrane anchor subunit [Mesorhizobium sp. 8]QDB99835.1 DMSO reductase [Mesorhizobium sp. 8]
MHPALSIIAFTTLSGLGYGLTVMLGLGLLDPAAIATKVAWGAALAAIGGGLLSSTLHLSNPQRAWRAFSQWRSSWLSREGVMAVVTFVPLLLTAWVCVIEGRQAVVPGLVGAVLSLCTVFCTAMIYASLKSVDAWHTRLTPACYLLFSLSGGAVAASFFAFCGGGNGRWLPLVAIVALVGAWAVKRVWRQRMQVEAPLSTPETATGLGAIGRVRLFERPHMTENYLTREMGFRVARKHAAKLWIIALALGGVVPFVLFALLLAAGAPAGPGAALVAGLALASHVVGVLAERWLFFAEARHAVMNYYGG